MRSFEHDRHVAPGPLRLLVLSNLYPPAVRGGYEVECHGVVEHLRRGHDVTVVTSTEGDGDEPHVRRLLPWSEDTRAGVLRAPLASLRATRVIAGVLDDVRPELVWVWNGAGVPYVALRDLHRSGIPVAYRVCEHWFGGIYDEDLLLRFVLGDAAGHGAWAHVARAANRLPPLRVRTDEPAAPTAISWNSRYLRDAVGVPPALRAVYEEIVHPVTAGADAMDGIPRKPADPPEVVFVGRLETQKGPDVAVRALAELRGRHGLDARLVVVGGGDETLVTATADELGVAAQVELTGPLRGAELHAWLSRASAWVIPSVWDEPAPNVCVEAALARVPAVAARVGGIPEMLHDEEHALLFERGDHAGCADQLARTLRGDGVAERTERAYARGRELAHGPYLAAMDAFLAAAVAALRA